MQPQMAAVPQEPTLSSDSDQERIGVMPLSKSWYYWAIALLLIAQVILSVNYHVLVCNMPIANTLLLLVIMAHHGYILGNQARPLFHRICGCVAFVAVLFVNTTHALELLTDTSDGHSHSHGDTENHEEDNEFAIIPTPYMFLSIIDVVLKILVWLLGHIPAMGLPMILQLVLHTFSPATVIFMYVLGITLPTSWGESWLWKHADPIVAVCMTVFFIALIIPAFREMMPYIFADTPESFNEDLFQSDVSKMFPDVQCAHIHAYRLWPGNLFEALLHINIKVDKSDVHWADSASKRYEEVRLDVNRALTKAGAQRVVVEPRFVDVTESNSTWVGCVEDKCFRRDKGCCGGEANSASA